MSPANPEWPVLLSSYEAAVGDFESVSRALTAALTAGNATDDDLQRLITSEERARETVILARMRLINLWRESSAQLHTLAPATTSVPMRDR